MILRTALTALTLLAAVPATAQAPRPFVPGFALLASSSQGVRGGEVSSFTLRRNGRESSIALVMAIAPKARAWASVRTVLREGPARATYVQGPCQDALAVVNGSFFYKDERGYSPMGLVRVDGAALQGPSPRTSGGFLTSDGRTVAIVPKGKPAAALKARFAVESAPILIADGASGMRSNDGRRYDRVAVGITADGDLMAIGAFGPSQASVSLWEFEKLAREAAARRGERIADLIAMDGGPSAHLYLPGGPAKAGLYGHLGRIYTPNVVCIGVRTP